MLSDVETAMDFPPTAKIPLAVAVTLVLLSAGWFSILLGVYLAFWVWQRGSSGAGLAAYVLLAVLFAVPYVHFLPLTPIVVGRIALTSVPVYFLAAFILRYELRTYFNTTQTSDIEMSPLWTALFAAPYLNYCLAAIAGED